MKRYLVLTIAMFVAPALFSATYIENVTGEYPVTIPLIEAREDLKKQAVFISIARSPVYIEKRVILSNQELQSRVTETVATLSSARVLSEQIITTDTGFQLNQTLEITLDDAMLLQQINDHKAKLALQEHADRLERDNSRLRDFQPLSPYPVTETVLADYHLVDIHPESLSLEARREITRDLQQLAFMYRFLSSPQHYRTEILETTIIQRGQTPLLQIRFRYEPTREKWDFSSAGPSTNELHQRYRDLYPVRHSNQSAYKHAYQEIYEDFRFFYAPLSYRYVSGSVGALTLFKQDPRGGDQWRVPEHPGVNPERERVTMTYLQRNAVVLQIHAGDTHINLPLTCLNNGILYVLKAVNQDTRYPCEALLSEGAQLTGNQLLLPLHLKEKAPALPVSIEVIAKSEPYNF